MVFDKKVYLSLLTTIVVLVLFNQSSLKPTSPKELLKKLLKIHEQMHKVRLENNVFTAIRPTIV